MDDKKFQEIKAKVLPITKRFVQEVSAAGLFVSAFVFNNAGDFLVKTGNLPKNTTPDEFLSLHKYLASISNELDRTGHVEATITNDSPLPPSNLALADKLALAVMAVPPTMLPGPVLDILDEYMESRKV